ncbi:MAG: hypothetical protein AAGA21_08755 [Pseudomonadota bacterium]
MRALPLIAAVFLASCASPKSTVETLTPAKAAIAPGSTVAIHVEAPAVEPAEDAPVDEREAYVLAKHLNQTLPGLLTYEGLFGNVVESGEQADYDMLIKVRDAHLELYGDNKTSALYGDVAELEITLKDQASQEVVSAFVVDAASKKKDRFSAELGGQADLIYQPVELVDLSVERILEGLDS